jgi:hypothetical protein
MGMTGTGAFALTVTLIVFALNPPLSCAREVNSE